MQRRALVSSLASLPLVALSVSTAVSGSGARTGDQTPDSMAVSASGAVLAYPAPSEVALYIADWALG